MKRETLSGFGLSKEQIDSVLSEYGKSVNDMKERLTTAEGERDQFKTQLETQQTELEQTYAEQQKDFAIQYAMKHTDALDSGLVMGLLDRDKITLADGELNGLNEQLETIKQERAFLFKPEENVQPTPTIVTSGNPASSVFPEKDAFSSITEKYQ
ncbi:phage scaffolding protein [Enterococcus faecalis]|uniref:phage scaffolding protein n=1 Tax=Enterococcus faecalis TaxID=1351 RepID=UPI003D0BD896